MAVARSSIVDQHHSGFYHLINRVVRRAWLCGEDPVSGVSYDHRKGWIEERLLELGELFSVDLYAYAVMSNHYHVVLHVDVERAQGWADEEVARRWLRLCPPKSPLGANAEEREQRFQMRLQALLANPEQVAIYRERLHSVSWLMRFLNESIARRANLEEGVSGRFWEGRFKSQALLDEAAVLACMAYVDLNPIRAGVTDRLEDSDHTSAQARIEAVEQGADADTPLRPLPLTPNASIPNASSAPPAFSTVSTRAYLELIDWTGRNVRCDKPGAIPVHLTPLFERLGLDQSHWLDTVIRFGRRFHLAAGHWRRLREKALAVGRCWLQGEQAARESYAMP